MKKIKLNSLAELCNDVLIVNLETGESKPFDCDYVTLARDYLSSWKEFRYAPTGDTIEVIEIEGGDGGGAQDCYTILKIGEQFFKVVYQYFSYNGFDFDYNDLYEVYPKEKTVTVYDQFRK